MIDSRSKIPHMAMPTPQAITARRAQRSGPVSASAHLRMAAPVPSVMSPPHSTKAVFIAAAVAGLGTGGNRTKLVAYVLLGSAFPLALLGGALWRRRSGTVGRAAESILTLALALVALAGAGYAGADFVEGFMTRAAAAPGAAAGEAAVGTGGTNAAIAADGAVG